MEFTLAELLEGAKLKPFRVFSLKDGESFNVYHEDAKTIADKVFNNDMLRKQDVGGALGVVSSLLIAPHALEKVLRYVLLNEKRHIEVYSKTDQGSWRLTKQTASLDASSIANLLSTNESVSRSQFIMSVYSDSHALMNSKIGAAFMDVEEKKVFMCQFQGQDQLQDLEALLIQVSPKECIVSDLDSHENEAMAFRIAESNVPIHRWKANDFTASLEKIKSHAEMYLKELEELKLAQSAFSALMSFLEMKGGTPLDIKPFHSAKYMKLDRSALRSLNLFPSVNDSSSFSSLFGLLNQCQTPMGSRLLSKWIKQPLLDIDAIKTRQNLVEVLVSDCEIRSSLHSQHLKHLMDFDKLIGRIRASKASLKDCVQLYNACGTLSSIVEILQSYDLNHSELLKSELTDVLLKCSEDFENFVEMVHQTIDLSAVERFEYLVNPEFSPELLECSKERNGLVREIDSLHEKVADDLGLDRAKVKRASSAVYGQHFRVPRQFEKKLRGNSDVKCLETRKDGVKFTTRAMKALSDAYETVNSSYQQAQQIVIDKIMEILMTYIPVIQRCSLSLSQLDVYTALAVSAQNASIPYTKPSLFNKEKRRISLIQSRHPCLEAQTHSQVIPNDVLIEESSRLQIITGPNMGGKSVYCKQIAMIVLMAQIGSFVPCESAEISVVDGIFSRVGAGDSQMSGVSTFMSEMLEASSIMKSASKYSLLIIDELGRGTSTYDGFGLAWAISEHIVKELQSFALFATHFHELTDMKSIPGVINKHVTALTTDSSITMLYEVKDGPCDQSFGIHVAELAKFPDNVVAAARSKVRQLELSQNEFKTSLERFRDTPLNVQSIRDNVGKLLKAIQ